MAFLHQRLVALNVTDASAIPKLDDLYLYRQPEPGDLPPAAAGAAALALGEDLPGFAMAFYPDLETVGRDRPAPSRLALLAEDAILLAPVPTATGWRGFLIADDTAAGQVREFRQLGGDPGPPCWLSVPADESAVGVWAVDGAVLAIAQSPDTPG